MKRRFILATVLSGLMLLATQGICRERIHRPVTRFIDFYAAARQAQNPPSVLERVIFGIALIAEDSR